MGKRFMRIGDFVLLDLGQRFAAGRVIQASSRMITLELHQGRKRFRPAYHRESIHQVWHITPGAAKFLGPFSHPTDPKA